nr:MAG TPA: hypothetical protein [Caudoviricetes sp.]
MNGKAERRLTARTAGHFSYPRAGGGARGKERPCRN